MNNEQNVEVLETTVSENTTETSEPQSFDGSTADVTTSVVGGDDLLATEELELPPAQPDAHRATIQAVTLETFEKTGSKGIKVSLKSQDADFETDLIFFPPTAFTDNPLVDPKTLSDVPPEGKKQSPKQRYAQTVANSKGTADLQSLRAVAKEQGRAFDAAAFQAALGKTSFSTIEEYVAVYNHVLAGLDVVFTRRPEKNEEDPRFDGRLKVNRILPISVAYDPKQLKNYKKAWIIE
jgi:hypothetical protein